MWSSEENAQVADHQLLKAAGQSTHFPMLLSCNCQAESLLNGDVP